ncbi:MAG: DUF4082 domain-containing protein [Propionibacteriaceae bacterium]
MIPLLRMFGPKPSRAIRSTNPRAAVTVVTAVALAASSAAIWSVATASAATPETIWGNAAPALAAVDSDTGAVELGTRFTAVANGQATGIRFYKTAENKGTHTGSLWSSTGSLLARATFSGETSSGWQTASLSAPVKLSAGTTYVVSYHSPYGRYTATEWFTGASASPNLSVASSNVGVFAYGSKSAFPTLSWHASQYWVDLTFSAGSSATTSATPVASTSTATATPATSTSAGASATSPSTTTATTAAPPATVTAGGVTTSSTPSTAPTGVTVTAATPRPTTAAPTATTAASGLTNCVSVPSRCGYPDATNTGVPAGTAMLRVPQDIKSGPGWVWDSRGWLQASSGAVVKNVIVSGTINMAGSNVTVTNTRVLVAGESWGIGLQHATNAVISNSEIGIAGGSPRLMVGIKDIYGDSTGTQVLRNEVVNTSTGIQVYEGLIADNYVHDMGYQSGDHINGTTSNGSTTMMTIRHNTILNQIGQTDAISLFQDFGIEANRLITDNLVAGGGYTIYGGDNQRFGKTSNIMITNNRFSNVFFPNGGSYGPIAAFDATGSGNVLSGNFWDHNLSAVKA